MVIYSATGRCLIQQNLMYPQLVYSTLRRVVMLHIRFFAITALPSDSTSALLLYTMFFIKAFKSSKTADRGGGYLPALQEKNLRNPRRISFQHCFLLHFDFVLGKWNAKNWGQTFACTLEKGHQGIIFLLILFSSLLWLLHLILHIFQCLCCCSVPH